MAEAADADRSAFGDFGDEFDGLATGGVGEKFAFVAIEELFTFFYLFGIKLEDLRNEFRFGCEGGQPDVEVAVGNPAVLGDTARRMTRNTDAQALLGRGGRADLESGEVEFLAHGGHVARIKSALAPDKHAGTVLAFGRLLPDNVGLVVWCLDDVKVSGLRTEVSTSGFAESARSPACAIG